MPDPHVETTPNGTTMLRAQDGEVPAEHVDELDGFKVRFVRRPAQTSYGVELSTGFTYMEPGSFEYTFTQDETLHVIAGRATVTVDGERELALGAGDGIFFPKGAHTAWVVQEPWRDFFTLVG